MRCVGVILLVLLLVSTGAGQDLSPLVLPSEEELLEALYEGDIDYEQYLTLRELLAFGIAPWESYLYDEIPNLSLHNSSDTLDPLMNEQAQPFAAESSNAFGGVVAHRSGLEAGGARRSSYRTNLNVALSDEWQLKGQIQREYSGRERVAQRSIEYRQENAFFSRAVLGSFAERFGLGTVVGRRGKLLDYDAHLSSESWLFPDNGGYNGLYVEGGSGGREWQMMLSYQRDSAYDVSTQAAMLSLGSKRLRPSLILNVTKLRDRSTDRRTLITSSGFNLAWKHNRGEIDGEAVVQRAGNPVSLSGIVEGRHRTAAGNISYSAWLYADSYNDLTSGSRSARISRNCIDLETGFAYTTRRSGQYGGIVKYTSEPITGYQLETGFAYGAFNADTSQLQIGLGLSHRLSKVLSVKVSRDERRLRRFAVGSPAQDIRRQSRAEIRYAGHSIRLRGYIGYGSQTGRHDFWTAFMSCKWVTNAHGLVEVWSNFGRLEAGRLAYWYGFLRHEQEVVDHFSVGVKLAQSYRRDSTPKRNTTLVLEATSRF